MHVIHAHNVNDAFRAGLRLITSEGMESDSRNGPVLRMAAPVSTVYSMPHERVLFDTVRHANPFFHLFEALWMLNGQRDVGTMDQFLKSFKQFSDDGLTFHGAYGYRWRHWPVHTTTYELELDQIARAITMLNMDRTTRRVVIGMWDPARDLGTDSKDIPCNDAIKLWIDNVNRLHMVVFNRSNDVVWGCYGANAVHMSILHEYLSAMTVSQQGTLTQISCDFHAYLSTPYDLNTFIPPDLKDARWRNPYDSDYMVPERLVTAPDTFDMELQCVMLALQEQHSLRHLAPERFANSFFRVVVLPMHAAWEQIRRKEYEEARETLRERPMSRWQNDWINAGIQWITTTLRRKITKETSPV